MFIINGAPLFYFDTAGYLRQGDSIFQMLDLFQSTAAPTDGSANLATNDGIVIGSRSVLYAVLLSTVSLTGSLWPAVAIQAAVLSAAIWIICAKAIEITGLNLSPLKVSAICLFSACLGSAGFYIAFLMPDVFAPILILSMAALIAFAPVLRFWSVATLVLMGATAVVVHPSHLAIALALLPACGVAAYLLQAGRVWRIMIVLALIPAAGIVERLIFNTVVEQATDSDVVYLPFSTARLISDGPGMVFLNKVCPTPEWATCALYAKLHSREQLSPAVILFSKSLETGSFALLGPEDRKAISHEALAFLRAVMLGHPIAVIRAAFGNAAEQLGLVSVKMTIPDPGMLVSASAIYPGFPETLKTGRLIADDPTWEPYLTRAHQAYYLLGLIAILGLVVMPRSRVSANLRAFAVLVLVGILANAFVMGALSQPADRYGARVIFLIPMLAVLLLLVRQPRTDGVEER